MKLALITGGSRGLGNALVDLYCENDWVVKEFSRNGTGDCHIDCDFADPRSSASILEHKFRQLGSRDWSDIILINNAGMLDPIGPVDLYKPVEWQKNIRVNLNSCITATGLFLKNFTSQDTYRYIANISSGAATKPYFGWSLYCASKAAMEAFTRCVAVEQSGLDNPAQCFIVIPGVIDTDMQSLIRTQAIERFEELERFMKLKSEGELESSARVAKAIMTIMESSPRGGNTYDVRNYF